MIVGLTSQVTFFVIVVLTIMSLASLLFSIKRQERITVILVTILLFIAGCLLWFPK